MSINGFVDYLKSLSPAMATLLLRGGVETLDSYARPRIITPGTAGIGLTWRRGKKGYYLGQEKSLTAGGGAISIVDSGAAPELRATSGTIFLTAKRFDVPVAENTVRYIAKRDEGSVGFELVSGTANRIDFFDGAIFSRMTSATLTGACTIAIRFASGAVPNLFTDGVFRVNGLLAVTPAANNADLFLANLYTLALGSRRNNYGLFAIFNDAILGRALTDQEIKNLSELWDSIVSIFEPKKTIFLPKPLREVVTSVTPVVEFSGPRNANNLVLDATGNGRNFTLSGGPLTQRSEHGRIIHSAYGKGGATGPLAQTAVDAALYPDPWTVSFKTPAIRTLGETAGRLFVVDTGGSSRSYLACGGTPLAYLIYAVNYSDGEAWWLIPISPNVEHIVIVRHDKSNPANLPEAWVDGIPVNVRVSIAKVGTLGVAASPRLYLLNTATLSRALHGDIEVFSIMNGLASDADVRDLYLRHALECNVLAHRTDYPVSVAAVAAGGNCGPVRVLSGAHKWDDDGTRRRLLGVAAGYFVSREASPQAYGAWYCRVVKTIDAGSMFIPLTGNVPKLLSDSDFNGYAMLFNSAEAVLIWKYTAGVAATVGTSAAGAIAINTEYELFVTRQSIATADGNAAGFFTVWIRGGAYATWTSLLTGTDDTHKTSNCLVGYNAGGYISDYRQYPNGSGLVPTDIPGLED